jgi:hypothetical protein
VLTAGGARRPRPAAEDLRRLTGTSPTSTGARPVEQRTSKAGLFALLSGARARSARSRSTGRRQLIAADVSGFQFDPGSDPDPRRDPSSDDAPRPGHGLGDRVDPGAAASRAGHTSASDDPGMGPG